jgi:hypothetical protein
VVSFKVCMAFNVDKVHFKVPRNYEGKRFMRRNYTNNPNSMANTDSMFIFNNSYFKTQKCKQNFRIIMKYCVYYLLSRCHSTSVIIEVLSVGKEDGILVLTQEKRR